MAETHNIFNGKAERVVQAGRVETMHMHVSSPAPESLSVLPPAPNTFTGRVPELDELVGKLSTTGSPERNSVITITGPPGAGKTALALTAAHRAVEAGRFPGGTLFADLHGYDSDQRAAPENVLSGFLRSMGVPGEHLPHALGELSALFRKRLSNCSSTLLVLDNVFHIEQIESLLPHHTEHRILITTRNELALPEARRLVLGTLSPTSSVDLLSDILRKTNRDDNRIRETDKLKALARKCDHLPLALRILAGILVTEQDRPLDSVLDSLNHDGDRLDQLDPGTGYSVRTALTLSYRCLDAEAANVFRLLALHPGNEFTHDQVATLVGRTSNKTDILLWRLRRAHLLQPGTHPENHSFHDLTRLYARERLETDEPATNAQEALGRLLEFHTRQADAAAYLLSEEADDSVVERAFETPVEALEWAGEQCETHVALVSLAVRHGHHERAHELACALDPLMCFRHSWIERMHVLHSTIEATQRLGDKKSEVFAFQKLANTYRWLAEHEESLNCLQITVSLAKDISERILPAKVTLELGEILLETGDTKKAVRIHKRAEKIFRLTNEDSFRVAALCGIGESQYAINENENSRKNFQKALKLADKTNDRPGKLRASSGLGSVFIAEGDHENAAEYLTHAVKLTRPDSDIEKADILERSADLNIAFGDLDEAVKFLNRALDLYCHLGKHNNFSLALEKLRTILPPNEKTNLEETAKFTENAFTETSSPSYRVLSTPPPSTSSPTLPRLKYGYLARTATLTICWTWLFVDSMVQKKQPDWLPSWFWLFLFVNEILVGTYYMYEPKKRSKLFETTEKIFIKIAMVHSLITPIGAILATWLTFGPIAAIAVSTILATINLTGLSKSKRINI
ncbi:tetratricopeptide repeat protein [Actinopolyspora xinjiangensis]|uniref:tetratricopeptide repeat protein n=1 Tax=Actinopolyspora xinjiangensis TaxID=405564 RepID=UPI000B87D1DE|nr:tetratricopeptide repeat protein [Actinopolyspora xinjiangensis]